MGVKPLKCFGLIIAFDSLLPNPRVCSFYVGPRSDFNGKNSLKCFGFYQVCTAKMNLGDEVDLEDYVSRPDKISAAEVS